MSAEKETYQTKKKKDSKLIVSILNGSIFTRREVKNQIPYILILVLLSIIYIGNRYHAESILAELIRVDKELKDTRAEWILINSELLDQKRQTHLIKLIREKQLGLQPLNEPPQKLKLDD